MKKLINYLYNTVGVFLAGGIMFSLRYTFTIIDIYTDSPMPAQILIASIGLFIFFIGAVAVKAHIYSDSVVTDQEKLVGKLVFYIFGFFDGLYNINIGSIIFFEAANKHGEGWMLTSRINYHILQVADGKALPGWRFKLARWFCRVLHGIDPWHCAAIRKLKRK